MKKILLLLIVSLFMFCVSVFANPGTDTTGKTTEPVKPKAVEKPAAAEPTHITVTFSIQEYTYLLNVLGSREATDEDFKNAIKILRDKATAVLKPKN